MVCGRVLDQKLRRLHKFCDSLISRIGSPLVRESAAIVLRIAFMSDQDKAPVMGKSWKKYHASAVTPAITASIANRKLNQRRRGGAEGGTRIDALSIHGFVSPSRDRFSSPSRVS